MSKRRTATRRMLSVALAFGLAWAVPACTPSAEDGGPIAELEKVEPPPAQRPNEPERQPDPTPRVTEPDPEETPTEPVEPPRTEPPRTEPPVEPDPVAPPEEPAPVLGGFGPGAPADLLPPPPEDPSRVRKRMDIDQLDAAIRRATGGVGWMKGNANQFEVLARTLGKPDYIDLTSEDLEASALFQKFLDDAARSACTELSAKELDATPEERVLMVHAGPEDTWKTTPDLIRKNLRYLTLRYLGKQLDDSSPELEPWRWLYESAEHVTKDPVVAWRTVCIGLITHPGFYTY